jgi:hypothetical protein
MVYPKIADNKKAAGEITHPAADTIEMVTSSV